MKGLAALTLAAVLRDVAAERPASKQRLQALKKVSGVRANVTTNSSSDQDPATADEPFGTYENQYEYIPAPGTLVEGEINRSRDAEAQLLTDLSTEDEDLYSKWGEKMSELRMQNSARLAAEKAVRNEEMEALATSVTAATNDFKQAHVKSLQDVANKAEAHRGSLQSTLFQIMNGLARIDCPPPAEEARGQDAPRADGLPMLGWNDEMPGAALQLEPLLGNRRFETFEEAWRICAETEGCSQVLRQEMAGSLQDADGSNILLADLHPEMTGYFLRRRLDPAKESGFTFDLTDAYASQLINGKAVVEGDAPRTLYSATDYKCLSMCPSACMSMTNGIACTECATPTSRDCTVCNPDTKAGCSGNCPIMMMDCRACMAEVEATTEAPAE